MMSSFIDVIGGSGRSYRFRQASTKALPLAGGNFLIATAAQPTSPVAALGATRNLNAAAEQIEAALSQISEGRLFVRLNVSRTVREAEHGDIAAVLPPETLFWPDLD